jgi:hypothetical protein
MKKHLNQLINKFNVKHLSQDILINDKTQPSKQFGDRYIYFLLLHKGVNIKTKDDLIILLNKRPRSFLSRLQGIVRTFQYSNNQLIKQVSSKQQDLKTIITNSKIQHSLSSTVIKQNVQDRNKTLTSSPSQANNNGLLYGLGSESSKLIPLSKKTSLKINKQHNIQLSANTSTSNILDVISKKINIYTDLLKNNNLSIPLHLLNPLLKQNSPAIKDNNLYTFDLKKLIASKNNKLVNEKSVLNITDSKHLGLELSTFFKDIYFPSLFKELTDPNNISPIVLG